jgi:hypothetical protein
MYIYLVEYVVNWLIYYSQFIKSLTHQIF